MRVNEYLLKISAAQIPVEGSDLGLGHDVFLLVEGSIVKVEDKDNQDGTMNRVYTVRGVLAKVSEGNLNNEQEPKIVKL